MKMEKQAEVLEQSQFIDMKQRFDDELSKIRVNATKKRFFLTETTYQKLINDVQEAKTTDKKKPKDYKLLKRYDVKIVENKIKLIYPVEEEGVDTIQYYITDSELFNILHETHLAIRHGRRDKMLKELSSKYKNITRNDIELYIRLCETCQKKQKVIEDDIVVRSINFSEFNSCCQVDLIDFQSKPDQEYKFIMVYQDYLTKFIILKSLTSNKAEEVANKLFDIFLMLGTPSILQSNNNRELADNVVTRLKEFCPALKIVHSQIQGSIERAYQDIKNMVSTWMEENRSDRWSEGLGFVQFMKNSTYHSGIKRTPYEAVFGWKSKLGLNTSSIPKDILKDINTEEELKKVIESIHLIGEEDEINHNLQEEEHDKDMLNEEISIFDICCVCLNETNDVLPACDKCDRKMHTFCGFASIHNENDILCNLCFKIENAIEHKIQCKIQLEMQSNNNKRKINSKNQFPIITLGTNVRIPIPNVNKVRNNSNILAVVINMTEDGFYQLGTSEGILKKLYTRSKFTLCRKNQLKIEDIPYREISIRDFSVAFAQSSGSGLGFIKCKCKKKCRSLKCLCLKNLMKCNLTCHSSLPCCNK